MKQQVRQFWSIVYKHVPKTRAKAGITWDLLASKVPAAQLATLNDVRRAFFVRLYARLDNMCRPFCVLNEAGSVTPTSDIDVSILYVQPIPVLRAADDYGRSVWGTYVRMSRLLAINFYTHNWYVPCGLRVGPKLLEDCDPFHFPYPDGVLDRQIGWAMQRLMDDGEALIRASPHFAEARRVRAFIQENKHLQMATHIQRMLDTVGDTGDLAANFDRTSMVAYVEDDAFYSVGAYLHVVVKMQKKRRMALPPKMYVMSFYDNLGFLYHTDAGTGSAAKYTHRCLDALAQLKAASVKRKKAQAVLKVLRTFLTAKKAGDGTSMTAALAEFEAMFPVKDDLMAWLVAGAA